MYEKRLQVPFIGSEAPRMFTSDENINTVNKSRESDQTAGLDRVRDENRELRSQVATLLKQNKTLQKKVESVTAKVYETLDELKKMREDKA